MRSVIISVGDELLRGEITNSNASYICQQLRKIGLNIQKVITVGDDLTAISELVKAEIKNNDLVLVTGGLGPTADDVTLTAVAAGTNSRLQTSMEQWKHIQTIFQQRQIQLRPENKRQAQYLGQPVPNTNGLALGSWLDNQHSVVIVLPGPPVELQAMIDLEVSLRLKDYFHLQQSLLAQSLHFLGRPESLLMTDLAPVCHDFPQFSVTSYVKPTDITIRVVSKDEHANPQMMDKLCAQIIAKEQPYYLGSGDHFDLATTVVKLLKQRGNKITAAESLTGGMFQSTICSVPGASNVFDGGFVTYAASAKEKLIGVPVDVVDQNGVVSAQTAAAMAEGCRRKMNVEVGLGFTGVAGPDALEGHPAGTVWLGMSRAGHPTQTKQLRLPSNYSRQQIRQLAVQYGLQMVYTALQK